MPENSPDRWRTRFDQQDGDPMASVASLVDIMLVFACGLIAALVAGNVLSQQERAPATGKTIEKGRELPEMPQSGKKGSSGLEAVGQVYRDPKTGRLILVDD